MKITNLSLLFVIIMCSIVLTLDIKMNNVQAITSKQIAYKQALDSAVDDAVLSLVEVDSTRELFINKESCLEKFYQSLYANFGILNDKVMQEKMKAYIPVMLVTGEDGYYLYYSLARKVNGTTEIVRQWSEKRPYVLIEDNLIINFTFDDYITIYDMNKLELLQGNYMDLSSVYPMCEVLRDKNRFDEARRTTILNHILDDMNYFINQHNRIAEHFGITYHFSLPSIDREEWYRTIDDIGFFVLFQGYPYGFNTNDVFNQFSYAGARIRKSDCYYISTDVDGKSYYHKETCSKSINHEYPYYSKKECALRGAYPCSQCNP